ncbi:MAG TPA: DUF948 domain-containing protein [Gemmatimonadaceae bacterium]|nr:DUF948 domain-containing protein [Gemmatimonadaceae bacterium]
MVMVLSLHVPIAVAAWLTQAPGAHTLPDTIVTKQIALSSGPLGTVAALANVVVAIAVIVLAAILMPAAVSLRRASDKANRLIDKLSGELSPIATRANRISDSVDSITSTVRADVEELSRTVRYVAERTRLGVEGVEQRVGELNTLISIAQNELEDAVVSTAATLHGVQAGVAALGGASPSRARRDRHDRDARDHDEELEHDHRNEARTPERVARPRPKVRRAPAPGKE